MEVESEKFNMENWVVAKGERLELQYSGCLGARVGATPVSQTQAHFT